MSSHSLPPRGDFYTFILTYSAIQCTSTFLQGVGFLNKNGIPHRNITLVYRVSPKMDTLTLNYNFQMESVLNLCYIIAYIFRTTHPNRTRFPACFKLIVRSSFKFMKTRRCPVRIYHILIPYT